MSITISGKINIYLGVPLRVGLSVPAFFVPKKNGTKKSSTAIPHARNHLSVQKLKTQIGEIIKILEIS